MIEDLMRMNREWAAKMTLEDPEFFSDLAHQQKPAYLWIGCSDSRVPANQIVGLKPGELFVHRNVANLVVHTDFNCLSVIEYAVEILGVRHIIVCGHYGCGGVKAALDDRSLGLIDNWLRHIKDVWVKHDAELSLLVSDIEKLDRLCELNVLENLRHVSQTTVVRRAWSQGRDLHVHAWIYRLTDGLVRDLGYTVASAEQADRL